MYLIIFSFVCLIFPGFVNGEEDDILLLMKANCQLLSNSQIYKSLQLDTKCVFYSGMQEERTLICLMVNLLLLLIIIRQNCSVMLFIYPLPSKKSKKRAHTFNQTF